MWLILPSISIFCGPWFLSSSMDIMVENLNGWTRRHSNSISSYCGQHPIRLSIPYLFYSIKRFSRILMLGEIYMHISGSEEVGLFLEVEFKIKITLFFRIWLASTLLFVLQYGSLPLSFNSLKCTLCKC